MHKSFLYSLILLLTGFSSCIDQSGVVYQKNIDLDAEGLYRDSILTFEFNIKDTSKVYQMFYQIRFQRDYPYSNLFLKTEMMDSLKRQKFESKDMHYQLFSADKGIPFHAKSEKNSLGDIFIQKSLIAFNRRQYVKFKFPGKYTLSASQNMRDINPLKGLSAIGISVEEVIVK